VPCVALLDERRLLPLRGAGVGAVAYAWSGRTAGRSWRVEAGVGHRSSEVEALAGVAAERCQLMVLLGGLDAFAHDGHPKAVGELDHGGHDCVAGGVMAEVGAEFSSTFMLSTGNLLR
jgi:hypothetical protein